MESNIISLLPKNTPSVKMLSKIMEKTGGFGDLMVLIESPDLELSKKYAQEILPEIKKKDWVDLAYYEIDDTCFRKNKLLYAKLEDVKTVKQRLDEYITEYKLRENPFYFELEEEPPRELDFSDIEEHYKGKTPRKYNASQDGKILILVIYPKGVTSDISFAKKIYAETLAVVERHNPKRLHPSMKVSVGGTYRNKLSEYYTIINDIKSSALWAGLGISLLIIIFFRRILSILLIGLPLIMSLSWTFAITYFFLGELNIITAFLIIILFGLGIDFGIHMFTRYRVERKSGASLDQALTAMVSKTGRSSFTAATTTAFAFFSLTFSKFLGFSHFGFIAGTGVLLALLSFVFIFPTVIATAENWHLFLSNKKFSRGSKVETDYEQAKPSSMHKKQVRPFFLIICTVSILTIISLVILPSVKFEYNFKKLRSKAPETRKFNAKMRMVFSEARDPAVVLVDDDEEVRNLVEAVRKKIDDTKDSPVAKVRSILDYLPKNQDEKLKIIKQIKKTLDKNIQYIPDDKRKKIDELQKNLEVSYVTKDDLPLAIKRPFLGISGTKGQLVYIYQRHSLLNLKEAKRFAADVRQIRAGGKVYYSSSEPIIYVDLVQILERDSSIAVFLVILVIFILVFMDVKNVKYSIVILTPLITGVLWMIGIMAATGIKLTIFNMVVLPSILGLGIDGAVHFYHRFQELGPLNLKKVFFETGGANFVSSATTMIGFGGLLSADHPGLNSIGVLAIIGMSTCLLATLTLLPSFLMVLSIRASRI